MTTGRPRAIALVAMAAALSPACAAKRVPEPVEPGHALIVLVPDPESQVTGQASIWNKAGSAELTRPRDAVAVAAGRPPGPVTRIDNDDLERLFGAALSALPPEPRSFTLYFKFETDELTEDSARLVPSVLATVKQRSDPEVSVIGHTDTMGAAKANIELGLKRAIFVRGLLVQAGLERGSIEVVSHGEAELLIRTPDETPEQRNRRVEITVR
jgi:outer membrane protein OmpA-like peptidoglycan-associated protein